MYLEYFNIDFHSLPLYNTDSDELKISRPAVLLTSFLGVEGVQKNKHISALLDQESSTYSWSRFYIVNC